MKSLFLQFSNRPSFFFLMLFITAMGACQKGDIKTDLFSNDPRIRLLALGKLSELNESKQKEFIPFLMESLNSNEPRIGDRAGDALKTIGPPALPTLTQALSDLNPYIRLSVTEVIGKIGTDVPGVVRALSMAMEDQHPLVREEAGLALGRSKETIGLLILALEDKNKEVRQSVARVLKLINSPESKKALKKFHSPSHPSPTRRGGRGRG